MGGGLPPPFSSNLWGCVMSSILISGSIGFLVGFFVSIFLRKIRQRFDNKKIEKEYREWRELMHLRGVGFSNSQIESEEDPFWDFDSGCVSQLCEELKTEGRKNKKSK